MPTIRNTVAVLKGDGIGIDVTDATLAVIEAVRKRVTGFKLDFKFYEAGAGYFSETGTILLMALRRKLAMRTRCFLAQ